MHDYFLSARHGSYDPDTGKLTAPGKIGIKRLAGSFRERAGDVPFDLVTSLAPRAVESGEVFCSEYGPAQKFRKEGYVWHASDCPYDVKSFQMDFGGRYEMLNDVVREEIEGSSGKALVFITHKGMDRMIGKRIAMFLGREFEYYKTELDEGYGYFFDVGNETVEIIPSE